MRPEFDVLVVGGGPTGLALAAALAQGELAVAVLEPRPPEAPSEDDPWDARVYAISPGVAAFLERCGAWARLPRSRLARIETMRIFGDEPGARLEFDAYEAGLRELAFVVEHRRLHHALWEQARAAGARLVAPARWTGLELGAEAARLRLEDGTELAARLLVGADGADSRIRARAGFEVRARPYGQHAVVANFACERPHEGVAYQWFRRDGVLALLPLAGERVSMVWSLAEEKARRLLGLDPAALAAEVAQASGGVLGALRAIAPACAFALRLQRVTQFTKPRVALLGDAAHNVHPLAGQGLNLGLRDARELAEVLRLRGPFSDCGEASLLRRYERARKEDVLAMQWTTDALQRLFNNDAAWLAWLRNTGLGLVDRLPLLKNRLVRQAVA
jgi:ubiquinone biosynthesis UbiH/UbiF/VisC/COQ6 family hydroxylase